VTGYGREKIAEAIEQAEGLSLPILIEVYNPVFAEGMFSSVRAGIGFAMSRSADGALFFPVDVPLVSPDTISKVVAIAEAPRAENPCFVLPVHEGKNGHPLFVPSAVFDEILKDKGNGGLRQIRDNHRTICVDTDDEGSVKDMDTPAEYEALCELESSRAKRPRIVLVRHGEPVRGEGPVFLGQTDTPLSEKGRREAEDAGAEFIRLGIKSPVIYASDLKRAKETAQIIAEKLGEKSIIIEEDKLLREMNMGSWDGELVSEIKAKFPDEYARRGEDIMNYRIPGGENFYDLSARVIREFYRLWRLERPRRTDLVLVAHYGVVLAVLKEITGDDGVLAGKEIPTGSVTVIDAPDWLL